MRSICALHFIVVQQQQQQPKPVEGANSSDKQGRERERERRNRYLKRLQLHSVGLSAAHSTLLPVKSGLFKKSQLRGMFKIACNGNSGFFINLCQAKMSVSGRKRRGRLPGYKLGNRFFLLCVHLDLRDYKCSDYQIWNKTSYYNLEACTCTYV